MSNLKCLAIDVDDTVYAFIETFLEGYNKKNETTHVLDGLNWDMSSLNDPRIRITFKKLLNDPTGDIILNSRLFPNASDVIHRLAETFQIVFVTSTYPVLMAARIQQLKRDFPGLIFSLVMTRSVLKSHFSADLFIDDKISTVRSYALAHPTTPVLLYDRPWNSPPNESRDNLPSNVTVVANWKDIEEFCNQKFQLIKNQPS